jgi:hypothetical protein
LRRTGGCHRDFAGRRRRNRPGWRWLFRLQIGQFKLHRPLDWNVSDTLCLVDPTVAARCFVPFFLRGLELLGARFRPVGFIRRTATHRAESDRDDHAEKNKQHHCPQPGGEQEARLLGMGECIFVVRHGQLEKNY